MRVALTGAPGTGKTTLAALLTSRFQVLAVRDLAEACGALSPLEEDGARAVDLDLLRELVGLHYFGEAVVWPTGTDLAMACQLLKEPGESS